MIQSVQKKERIRRNGHNLDKFRVVESLVPTSALIRAISIRECAAVDNRFSQWPARVTTDTKRCSRRCAVVSLERGRGERTMEIQLGLPLFEKRLVCSTILCPITPAFHGRGDAYHFADCPIFFGVTYCHLSTPPPSPPISEFNKREGCRFAESRTRDYWWSLINPCRVFLFPPLLGGIRILCGRNSWLFFISEILRVEFYYVAAC